MNKRLDSGLMRLPNLSLTSLGRRTIDYIESCDVDEIKENGVIKALSGAYIRFDTATSRRRTAEMGKQLIKASTLCNARYTSFKKSLQATALGEDEEKAKMANYVLVILQRNGRITTASYSQKIGNLYSLLEKLAENPQSEMIDKMGLRPSVDALDRVSKSFNDLFLEAIAKGSILRDQPTATELKQEYADALRNVIIITTAMKDFPGWDKFYGWLYEVVTSTKRSAKGRKRRTPPPTDEQSEGAENEEGVNNDDGGE